MKRVVLAIVDRLDRGDCRRCGAPAEERHAECWRVIFDWLRDRTVAPAARLATDPPEPRDG